jgi:membrane-associated phospholipid phosphatase
MLNYDWFGNNLRERIPLVAFLLTWQTLYFVINRYLADKGGWVADIEAIDGNMPLIPVFAVPYILGLGLMPFFTITAAWKFPRDLFQRYAIAFFIIMTLGFAIWLLFPAYVVKEPVEGSGFFRDMVKKLHGGDDSYGTHNAIPSSHVYYVTIAMCYFILWKPTRPMFIFGVTFAVINALSTMLTHQHYLLDVLAGWLQTIVVFELTERVIVPYLRKEDTGLKKRDDPMIVSKGDAIGD